MRIRKVEAHAFGPFRGETLELAPGLTVVVGPNEAGKSTWHAALYAALCGMRRGRGRPRTEDQEFADRHAPWDGERWEVGCRIALADGRTIELRHDLAGLVDCSAKDLTNARDISDELMNEQTPDGSRLLGLTREVMLATACVRQAQVLNVLESPEKLQQHLQAAAASGGGDVTAQGAIERLGSFRREAVGTARTRTAPLDEAREALKLAEQRAEEAQAAHTEYLELVRQHEEASDEAEQAKAQLVAARLAAVERRAGRARDLAADLPDELPDVREERELLDTVAEALHTWSSRPAEPELPDGPSAAELEQQLADLPDAPSGDTEAHPSVEQAEEDRRTARTRLEAHREQELREGDAHTEVGVEAGDLRRAAEELETPIPEVDEELAQRVETASTAGRAPAATAALGGGAVAVVAGLLLVAAGIVVVGVVLAVVGLAVAGWGWWSGQAGGAPVSAELQATLAVQRQARRQAEERRQRARGRVEAWGLAPEPEQLRRLAARVDDAAGERERRQAWTERLAALSEQVEAAERRLRQVITTRDPEISSADDPPVEALLRRYREACRRRATQAARAARREALADQLRARRTAERAVADDRAQRQRAAEAVIAAARAVGIEVDGRDLNELDPADVDPSELVAPLRTWRSEQQAATERVQELRRRRAALDELLGERTVADLEAEADRLRRELVALPDPEPVELGTDPEAAIARLQERTSRASNEVADLRGQITAVEESLVDVAEAQEQAERLRVEVDRFETLGQTIDRTLEFMTRARDRVQRDIAPRLAAAVEEHLPRITQGRYTEVTVDPEELRVEVRGADGRWRSAVLLSHGTAEQIYLLLRLAMTEHLVTTDEPAPLILDDVTVQSDRTRTTAFLELLHELSADRQVILFSQEQEVAGWAAGRLEPPRDRIVDLPAVAVGSTAAPEAR